MPNSVREVDEIRSLRTHDLGRFDRLLHVEMGRMWPAEPKSVQHQNAHTREGLQRGLRKCLGVGDVPQRAHAKAVDADGPVRHHNRLETVAENHGGFIGAERVEPNTRLGRASGRGKTVVENVREPRAQQLVVFARDKRGDVTAIASREGTKVIDTMQVVRVKVGIPHRIDVVDTRSQQLETQFRWRIDQNRAVVHLQQSSVPGSFVPDVTRGTDVAVAPDDRHTERGSGTEKCEFHESVEAVPGGPEEQGFVSTSGARLALCAPWPEALGTMTIQLISDSAALQEMGEALTGETRLALDLEAAGFHRYSDRVCLLQVTVGGRNFIVDTLAVDPSAVLRGPLEDPDVTILLHGGDYDLRLLDRDLDLHPVNLFDTQTAAALLGEPSLGLAALLQKYLEVHVSKKYQRADWAQRPLPEEMLDYAASDTRHLHELADLLMERLEAVGRESWAAEETRLMEGIRWNANGDVDPVTRVKGVRAFELRDVALVREAWLWRDEIAQARDRAPFRVAGDPVLLEVVRDRPRTVPELARVGGFSPALANQSGGELLDRLERIDRLDDSDLVGYPSGPAGPRRPDPEVEEVANRLKGVRNQAAEALGIDRGVLMSNTVILEIARIHPRSEEELRGVEGVKRWQSETMSERLLAVL
jgi:ribonuclease D